MRVLLVLIALAAATPVLQGCVGTSDPRNPAIQAMQGVNACGSYGQDDIQQCRRARQRSF